TAAAAAGGYTAVACMPNTKPVADTVPVVDYIVRRGREAGRCRVYPIAAMTKNQAGKELTEMLLLKEAGAVAVSDDGRSVADSGLMKNVLTYAAGAGLIAIAHCEDGTVSDCGSANEGYNASLSGLKGISRAAEEIFVARDLVLAAVYSVPVHIAHVSTKGSVELIREAKKRDVLVTCETCPHYFTLTDEKILGYDTSAKINPPIREKSDVDAIVAGLADGTIDAVATDHAPHHRDDKDVEFESAAFGTTGLECALPLAYTYLVRPGHITIEKLAALMSVNPAKILGVPCGTLAEGAPADVTVFDPRVKRVLKRDGFSKARNCVFDGMEAEGEADTVIVNGVITFYKGQLK
ncbi:MAG: dihydroorotase, partial [Firmicutes bacterium]|nr:dihydroorotase [Bacillota bacterium]